MRSAHSVSSTLAAFAAMLFVASEDSAQAAGADFAGKTITIVVGFGPGGGYDAYARLAADHLGDHLPGNPTVVVENMPGGGGRASAVYMATAAPKDGTVISIVPANIAFDSVRGEFSGNVDPNAFGFIGRITPSIESELTWHTSPTKTFEDAKQRETLIASDGATGNGSMVVRIMNERFGTKFKLVEGYKGTAEMALAMERGEVEGMVHPLQTLAAMHPDWVEEKKVNFLWQQATTRDPSFPDVPAIVEFATNDEERALLELVASQGNVGRSLAAPPGIAEDTLATFRAAFDEMVQDPDFIADAARRKLPIDPVDGETVQGYVGATMSSPETTVAELSEILKLAVE